MNRIVVSLLFVFQTWHPDRPVRLDPALLMRRSSGLEFDTVREPSSATGARQE
jgi:hypothetical protein